MTVKALTGLVPEWYTPKGEEDEATPAEFHVKPLTAPQVAKVQSEFDGETGEISGNGLYNAATMVVIGWKNVNDHNDRNLKFSKRALDQLPFALLLELGGKVLEMSFLSEDKQKNL